jgi:hypothetical protein
MAEIAAVVQRALARLVALQEPDGSFRDFALGMGASGPWVTAHVALRLRELPERFADAGVAAAIARARDYFVVQPAPRWSYNERVPEDADTIAHVLVFLDAVDELSVDGARRLARHQRPDGGFATFLPEHSDATSWRQAHPDITPVALRALSPYRSLPGLAMAIDHGLARRELDGAEGWPAFWWDLAWYTRAMWCAAARALGVGFEPGEPPAAPAPRSPLDAAHLLDVACAAGWTRVADAVAAQLAAAATADGSWPVVPVLRVTLPTIERPWRAAGDDGGRLYADVRGVYSAAAIAGALSRYLNAR